MAVIPPSAEKHKLEGIGAASAAAILAALLANPSTAWLATGFVGKITFFILTKVFSGFASMGLVLLNVGAEKLMVTLDKVEMDGTWDSAEKFIDEIRKTGRDLTPEEIRTIDLPVINQFRKFAKMARKGAV